MSRQLEVGDIVLLPRRRLSWNGPRHLGRITRISRNCRCEALAHVGEHCHYRVQWLHADNPSEAWEVYAHFDVFGRSLHDYYGDMELQPVDQDVQLSFGFAGR